MMLSELSADRRAQAVQIGAFLLLGILVLTLGFYQIHVVPVENEAVEGDAYQTALNDMQRLQGEVQQSAHGGGPVQLTVKTGTRYPTGIVRLNPSPAAGSLSAEHPGGDAPTIVIENATAIDENAAVYWNGTTRRYNTTSLVFTPRYNYLDADSVVFGTGGVYINSSSGHVLSTSEVVNGRTITLVSVKSDVEVQGPTSDLSIRATSQQTETVSVTAPAGRNVTIRLRTGLSAEKWNQRLAGNDHVTAVAGPGESVELRLEGGTVYDLQMAEVTVTESDTAGGPGGASAPAYLYPTSDTDKTVAPDETATYELQVRDQFNNGHSNVELEARHVPAGLNVTIGNRSRADGTVLVHASSGTEGIYSFSVVDSANRTESVRLDAFVQEHTGANYFIHNVTLTEATPGINVTVDIELPTQNATLAVNAYDSEGQRLDYAERTNVGTGEYTLTVTDHNNIEHVEVILYDEDGHAVARVKRDWN